MAITTAVVPVAGLATRLRPLSCGVPKGLLPVAGSRDPARRRRAVGLRDRARRTGDRAWPRGVRRPLRRERRARDGLRRAARAARPRRRDPARRAGARRPVRHRAGRRAAGPWRPRAGRAAAGRGGRCGRRRRRGRRGGPARSHAPLRALRPAGAGDDSLPIAGSSRSPRPGPPPAGWRSPVAMRRRRAADALREPRAAPAARSSCPTRSARWTKSSPSVSRPARSAWTSGPCRATARPSSSTALSDAELGPALRARAATLLDGPR